MGAISLFEFLKHSEDLVVLPDIGICSDGPVRSCLLISQMPLSDLDGAPVALCSTSRTSARLAELLLSEVYGVRCRYFFCLPDLAVMMRKAPAAVLIGDLALQAAQAGAAPVGLEVHDLGQMWNDWTGLPFVFAVMAARREFVARRPEAVRRWHRDLLAARDLSLAEVDQVCAAARSEKFDAATLKHYYTSALDFNLGERHLQGITEFARRVGELSPDLEIELFVG